MSTQALSVPFAALGGFGRTLRLYLREIRFEVVRAARNKAFSLSVIGFPTMFYLLFGVMNKGDHMQGGRDVAKYLLASYASFGMVGAALFGIGVGLAMERTSGWLELKRASPMPPLAYLVARCAMAVFFSLVIVSILCAIGVTLASVHLSLVEYARMLSVTLIASIPFAAMGLMLGMLIPPTAAPGVVNMIYLPMSFCSGLWIPFFLLPKWLQHVAPALPAYHLAQLMQHTVGYAQRGDSVVGHVLALLGFTVLFLGVACIAYRRADADA